MSQNLDPSKPISTPIANASDYSILPSFSFASADSNSRLLDQLIAQVVTETGSSATTTNKTIRFAGTPLSGYYFRFPIWADTQAVFFEGDGQDYSRISGQVSYPTFIFGLVRNPAGHVLTSANFTSLAGIIDAPSLTLLGGSAYGLNTLANTTFSSPGTSGAFGPPNGGWPAVMQLHVGFYASFGTKAYAEPIAGISLQGACKPFVFRRSNTGFPVHFALTDGIARQFTILSPIAPGPCRLDFQIDTIGKTVTAWVDNVQVAVDLSTIGSDWLTSPQGFAVNDNLPFRIAGEGQSLEVSDYFGICSDDSGNPLPGVYPDFTLYGLAVHSDLRYQNLGVGKPQARIGNVAESDYSRYYSGSDLIFAFWPGLIPTDVIQFRCPQFLGAGGGGGSYALWLDPLAMDVNAGTLNGGGLRDLSVSSGGGATGVTVLWGHWQHGRIERVTIDNGAIGLGTLGVGSNYPISVVDCTLGGFQCAVSLYYGIYTFVRPYITRMGRFSFLFSGSNVSLRDAMIAGNGSPENIIKILAGDAGGCYLISNLVEDFEDGVHPSQSIVYCEGHSWNAPTYRTNLRIENMTGNIPPGAVGVDLKAMGPSTPSGHIAGIFSYSGLNLGGTGYVAVVRADDPFWSIIGYQEAPGSILPWLIGNGTSIVTPRLSPVPAPLPIPAPNPSPNPVPVANPLVAGFRQRYLEEPAD